MTAAAAHGTKSCCTACSRVSLAAVSTARPHDALDRHRHAAASGRLVRIQVRRVREVHAGWVRDLVRRCRVGGRDVASARLPRLPASNCDFRGLLSQRGGVGQGPGRLATGRILEVTST